MFSAQPIQEKSENKVICNNGDRYTWYVFESRSNLPMNQYIYYIYVFYGMYTPNRIMCMINGMIFSEHPFACGNQGLDQRRISK